jgi:hypothetical protein
MGSSYWNAPQWNEHVIRLLVNGMGYETGGNDGKTFDNEKGFFERMMS